MRIVPFAALLALSAASLAAQQTTPAAPASKAPPATTQDTTPAVAPPPAVVTPSTDPVPGATPPKSKADDKKAKDAAAEKADSMPSPGEALDPHIKKGTEEDVDAIGNRNIGGRGMGNWYSTNWEIGTGKQYSMELEKSSHLVNDPVVVEYVNRVGQNIVKNSDSKVPFTIKVLDTDEINAMALPGGFFYVNSGLILACDSEDELAGVMAHEIAHVAAHHAAREMTRMNYMQIGQIPLIIFTQGTYTGYGIYEASQLAIPLTFLKFSRQFEARPITSASSTCTKRAMTHRAWFPSLKSSTHLKNTNPELSQRPSVITPPRQTASATWKKRSRRSCRRALITWSPPRSSTP